MDSVLDDHSRTIVHIDIDCFYAQVEMIKNPSLCTLPLGIQQKNIVVTSNYVARNHGIKKCMLASEARNLCPDLVLVRGEDLHDYRQTSYKVTALLQKYTNLVERLGLDENFLDITNLVHTKLKVTSDLKLMGNIFGDISDICECGCSNRLKMGSVIAQEIRDDIKSKLGLTTSAGIGHNKLLAKLAGSRHKPNQQTIVFPNSAVELMLSLNCVQNIPFIGTVLSEQLRSINVNTVPDLQNVDLDKLKNLLGYEKAKTIYDLGFGIDKTAVRATGKPQSIGIEDSCKAISVETEIQEKLKQLLKRLLVLVSEDGRTPKTIKLTIRKFDKNTKTSNRETRQCNINSTLFNKNNISELTESNENKIMTTIMTLFKKLVNTSKPYHITLLGLSFTKFVEKPSLKSTLTNYLIKDIEVQSVTNIENLGETNTSSEAVPSTSYGKECLDSELEPSSKKLKLNLPNLTAKRRFMQDSEDCEESPSKLRVAELRLNSSEKPIDTNQNICCPPDASEEVFRELPYDMQVELWQEYQQNRDREKTFPKLKKSKPNSILNYVVKH